MKRWVRREEEREGCIDQNGAHVWYDVYLVNEHLVVRFFARLAISQQTLAKHGSGACVASMVRHVGCCEQPLCASMSLTTAKVSDLIWHEKDHYGGATTRFQA